MTLQTNFYFLSPVEVARVSPKNLEEVAAWCGGKVAETESRRVEGRMDKYVWVPTPKGTAISWAFPGMFITKRVVVTEKNELKVTYSVFRKDYFNKNYFETPDKAVVDTWERQLKEAGVKITHKPQPGANPGAFIEKPELVTGPLNEVPVEGTPNGLPVTVVNDLIKAGPSMVAQREILSEAAVDDRPNAGVNYADQNAVVREQMEHARRMADRDPHRA